MLYNYTLKSFSYYLYYLIQTGLPSTEEAFGCGWKKAEPQATLADADADLEESAEQPQERTENEGL